jgi:hypothetical protein
MSMRDYVMEKSPPAHLWFTDRGSLSDGKSASKDFLNGVS